MFVFLDREVIPGTSRCVTRQNRLRGRLPDYDDITFAFLKKDQLIKINLTDQILTGWRGFLLSPTYNFTKRFFCLRNIRFV